MKKFKQFITGLSLTALVAVSLAGCTASNQANPEDNATQSTDKQEVVELNYYSHSDENGERLALIEAFEKENPGVKVNLVELPADTNKKLSMISTTLQAENASLDIFDADVTWAPIFASAEWVEPLDDYLTPEEMDAYLPGAMLANYYEGKHYGIPYRTDTGMLYYRKDLLEKYNKPVPTTWDELTETAKFIMDNEGGNMSGHAGSWKQYEGLTCNLTEFIWSYGGRVLDENGKVVLNSKESVAALKRMTDMVNTDKITPEGVVTFGSGGARAVFFAGDMVFLRDWPSGWSKSQNTEKSKVVGKVGIAALPSGSDDMQSYSTLGGWQVMVSSFSEHKEEAIAFAKFRASEYAQIEMAKRVSHIPSLKGLYSNDEVLEAMPFLEQMYPAIANAYPRPKTPFYAELSNILQVEAQQALIGNKTPEQAILDADASIKTLLEQ